MQLSILILSVFERQETLGKLLKQLENQIGTNKEVEVLVLTDNRRRTIGTKRTNLVQSAQGKYVVFIDDDDRIAPNYVSELLKAIESEPDCICFNVLVHNLTTGLIKVCKYATNFTFEEDIHYYYRKPNHIMCYRKSIADKHKYADISYTEDFEWSLRAASDIKSAYFIDKILYYYECIDKPDDWYFVQGG